LSEAIPAIRLSDEKKLAGYALRANPPYGVCPNNSCSHASFRSSPKAGARIHFPPDCARKGGPRAIRSAPLIVLLKFASRFVSIHPQSLRDSSPVNGGAKRASSAPPAKRGSWRAAPEGDTLSANAIPCGDSAPPQSLRDSSPVNGGAKAPLPLHPRSGGAGAQRLRGTLFPRTPSLAATARPLSRCATAPP